MRSTWRWPLRVVTWLAALAPFVVLAVVMLTRISTVEKADGKLVITRGREAEVMAYLSTDARTFAGVPIGNIMIDHDVIVLQMEQTGDVTCELPRHLHGPGGAVIGPKGSAVSGASSAPAGDLIVSWVTCGSAGDPALQMAGERLAGALANRPHDRVWSWVEGHAPGGVGGILAPFFRKVDSKGSPGRILGVTFGFATLLALLAALLAPRAQGEPITTTAPTKRRFVTAAAIAILLLVGAVLRVRASTNLPLDTDEAWALPTVHSVVTNDHDAWVHPPMHRSLQQAWVHAIGWHEGDSLQRLRLPSLVASLAALVLLLVGLGRASHPIGFVAVVGVAVAPALVVSSVLARPYALAALGVVIVAVSLFSRAKRHTSGTPSPLGWFVAILGVALAAWTDLVAGMAGGLLLACAVITSIVRLRARALPSAAIALLATVVFCAPLVPGAWVALHDQVKPMTAENAPAGPDLRPSRGPGQGELSGLLRGVAQFDVVGVDPASNTGVLGFGLLVATFALFGLAGRAALRERDFGRAIAPLTLFVWCVLVGQGVALRSRNILFLPLVSEFLVAGALTRLADRLGARTSKPE